VQLSVIAFEWHVARFCIAAHVPLLNKVEAVLSEVNFSFGNLLMTLSSQVAIGLLLGTSGNQVKWAWTRIWPRPHDRSAGSFISTHIHLQYMCLHLLLFTAVHHLWDMLGALTVINPLKLNGKRMYHLLLESAILHFIFMGFLAVNTDNFLKQHYPVDLFKMVKWCVFFEVGTKCSSIMCMSFCLR
jgi:hypothetical protein